MPLRTVATVVPRVHLPPGWAKLWWPADCIQYGNQAQASKKHSRFFSERIHAPAASFISKNEGMNEGNVISWPMKRLTIDVPIDLHIRLKTGCAVRGEKIADVIRSLIEREFAPRP